MRDGSSRMKLLIVESPAKAKTINKYLGHDYTVMASIGHICDLPSRNGSVEPDNNFALHYQLNPKSVEQVRKITEAMRRSDTLLLAPDPDREGEAIAWHVYEELKKRKVLEGKKIERVVFNAITKEVVTDAIQHPRAIDMDLVNAQQARRALDYLVGFNLSPVLWRRLPGSKSAGRVQSVALRLVVEREKEIENFKTQEFWDIVVDLQTDRGGKIAATVTEVNKQKLEKFSLNNQAAAEAIAQQLQHKQYVVLDIQQKETRRNPYPPFVTSTLQQEASKKLGFSAKRTMSVAQRLYEGVEVKGSSQGLITYMRTDGVYTAPEAIQKARGVIANRYGQRYLPAKPILYQNKVKNAQEAHEAIRPTDPTLTPEEVKPYLERDQFLLYQLIWQRLLASQMNSVILNQVTINIATTDQYANLKATGSTIVFDGFYAVYAKETDDDNSSIDEDEHLLPEVHPQEALKFLAVDPRQHFTTPPPRYTEATLVKKMEELGIGRPSTYAAILSVIQEREYVRLEKRRFFTEDRGRIVTEFLKEYFQKYVEYDYTAKLEDDLDKIANGEEEWHQFLQSFWSPFKQNIDLAMETPTATVLEHLNNIMAEHVFGKDEEGHLKNTCPKCHSGSMSIKIGKFGVFLGCSNYPECRNTTPLFKADAETNAEFDGETVDSAGPIMVEPKVLGADSQTGQAVTLRRGPYGYYLQLGEAQGTTKPKRVSLAKDVKLDQVDLAYAERLLKFPMELGLHPETGKVIKAAIGPYGPYVAHDGCFYSVKSDISKITLEEAVAIIAANPNKRKAARTVAKTAQGARKAYGRTAARTAAVKKAGSTAASTRSKAVKDTSKPVTRRANTSVKATTKTTAKTATATTSNTTAQATAGKRTRTSAKK